VRERPRGSSVSQDGTANDIPKTGAAAAGEEVSYTGAGAAEEITSSSLSASVKDEL
jgi:hypothetical protein